MKKARLILDSHANGAMNMSIDQALLETADSTGLITLRFYTWSEPTLSLGYFQSHADRKLHPPSSSCTLVRRRTGGGAILHDAELTYSLCVPSLNRWSTKNTDLYLLVHQAIIEVLAQRGINSSLYSDLDSAAESAEDPNDTSESESQPQIDQKHFMCFKRRSHGDIVLKGHKVIGSAQRRIKNSLLQHGSILLGGSLFAPSLPGIGELSGTILDSDQLSETMAKRIFHKLNCEFSRGLLQKEEKEAGYRIYSSHFNSDSWNRRR